MGYGLLLLCYYLLVFLVCAKIVVIHKNVRPNVAETVRSNEIQKYSCKLYQIPNRTSFCAQNTPNVKTLILYTTYNVLCTLLLVLCSLNYIPRTLKI